MHTISEAASEITNVVKRTSTSVLGKIHKPGKNIAIYHPSPDHIQNEVVDMNDRAILLDPSGLPEESNAAPHQTANIFALLLMAGRILPMRYCRKYAAIQPNKKTP